MINYYILSVMQLQWPVLAVVC